MSGEGDRVRRRLPDGRLRKLRLERELSQLEVAIKAEVDVGTISRLELGLHYPSLRSAWRICKVLGVSFDQLKGE